MSPESGRYLAVDLAARKSEVREVPGRWLRDYLGGLGLATRLYLECSGAGADALGPDNPIVFACGPLSGTMAPASAGHAVVTRSPATGFLYGSLSFGLWSLALARTGCDAVVITGAAASPVYLLIDDGRVHFRQAGPLTGQGCPQTAAAIRRQSGDSRVQVACIGPAGESRARLATISDGYRLPHRGGAGAVMGAKNLKAIAVRGTRPAAVADIDAMREYALELAAGLRRRAAEGGGLTPGACLLPGGGGCHVPARNYRQSIPGGVASLAAECTAQGRLIRAIACPACPVACQHVYRLTDDPRSDEQAVLDDDSLAALGPLCGVFHLPVILKAVELCQFYGLDPVSTGAAVAWAMECFEQGLVSSKDTQGLDLSFGSADGLVETVRLMGRRAGIGGMLADGVRSASNALGQGSGDWAMHVRGLEMVVCDPRTQPGLALRLAAGLRPLTIGDTDEGPRPDIRAREDLAGGGDCLAVCPRARRYFQDFPAQAARMYTLATGMPLGPAELRLAGERANTLTRAIDIRDGRLPADDRLPPRLLREPPDTGEAAGAVVSEKGLAAALDGYYRERGWGPDGSPPGEELATLGMDDVRQKLKGNGHGAPPHTV